MAGLNPLDNETLRDTGLELDQGFSLDKLPIPPEQQVGADNDLQRSTEKVVALEAWLSSGQKEGIDLNTFAKSQNELTFKEQNNLSTGLVLPTNKTEPWWLSTQG